MAQITNGLRAVLSNPQVYSAFQSLMGAHQARKRIASQNIRPYPCMKMLDIGCGPADILFYLPDIEYWGVDISAPYIERAKKNHPNRGHFYCKELTDKDLEGLPQFDVVLAIGVLHHLDDSIAREVAGLACKALAAGGRFITIDPCLDKSQNIISEFLVRHDRGQNVRTKIKYQELVTGLFSKLEINVRHQTWIPYTHCIMECTK